MGDPAVRRFGRSAVTLSLRMRILLSLPALLPPWLVVRFVRNLAAAASGPPGTFGYPGSPIGDVLAATLGLATCFALPRYLRSVWADNPDWRRADRQALAVQLRAQEALDKEGLPAAPIEGRTAPPRW
jgi:hypothetical protein